MNSVLASLIFNLLKIINCLTSEMHKFIFLKLAMDNQSCEILKWHSAVTYRGRISKVLKLTLSELHIQSLLTHRECHQFAHAAVRSKT